MRFTYRRKGQSAIEYLTTYGWMLLVVAIVGGAIFTTVQGQAQIQTVLGFDSADVGINNFGVAGNELALEVVSQGNEPVTVTNVTVSDGTNTGYATSETGPIPLGESDQVRVAGVTSSEPSNTLDVQIEYTIGELTDLSINGTITGNMKVTG